MFMANVECHLSTYLIQFIVKVVKPDFDTDGIVLYKPSYYTFILQKKRVKISSGT